MWLTTTSGVVQIWGVTKDIRITDSFSLPVFGRLIANPYEQHFYFVAGFTLKVL